MAVALGVAGLFACGPPLVYDTDLRPVRDPLLVASVDYGWLAVDSTETGVRVVLQLEFEAPRETSEYLTLHVPALRCATEGIHYPDELRREAPICPSPASDPPDCQVEPGQSGPCPIRAGRNMESCLHVVRAVFYFPRMPHFDDSHYFTFGQTNTPVRWTRR